MINCALSAVSNICLELFEWNTFCYCVYQYLRYFHIMLVRVLIRNSWIHPFDLHDSGMSVDVGGPFGHWSGIWPGLAMMLDALHTGVRHIVKGYQSTRHMTNSSHGQLVKKLTRHSQLVTRPTHHTVKSSHCISQLVTQSTRHTVSSSQTS